MKVLRLHPSDWLTEEDVFDALLTALQAPKWHAKDVDALWESITDNKTNGVRTPFRVVIVTRGLLPYEVENCVARLENLFYELNSNSVDVEFSVRRATESTP